MHGVDEIVSKALLTQFNAEQIYHDDFPETCIFPALQYTTITEVPALHADDKLYGTQHVIRVTIATYGNAEINALKNKVFQCMSDAGFVWENTSKVRDKNEYYTSLDFSILERNE